VTDDATRPDSSDRASRDSVMLTALVESFGDVSPSKHRVRNLSSGGARIDKAGDLRAGATVLVTVGALQAVGATVAWVKDDSAGLKFAKPVDPDTARAGALVAPRSLKDRPRDLLATPPTTGWMPNVIDPYRR
jgi:hypothetical protein